MSREAARIIEKDGWYECRYYYSVPRVGDAWGEGFLLTMWESRELAQVAIKDIFWQMGNYRDPTYPQRDWPPKVDQNITLFGNIIGEEDE